MSEAAFVQVRIPAPLRDRIDAVRGTEKREPWVRRALESALGETTSEGAEGIGPIRLDGRSDPAPAQTRAHASVLNTQADALLEEVKPELCKSCETLGPPRHKPCWKCGAQT